MFLTKREGSVMVSIGVYGAGAQWATYTEKWWIPVTNFAHEYTWLNVVRSTLKKGCQCPGFRLLFGIRTVLAYKSERERRVRIMYYFGVRELIGFERASVPRSAIHLDACATNA